MWRISKFLIPPQYFDHAQNIPGREITCPKFESPQIPQIFPRPWQYFSDAQSPIPTWWWSFVFSVFRRRTNAFKWNTQQRRKLLVGGRAALVSALTGGKTLLKHFFSSGFLLDVIFLNDEKALYYCRAQVVPLYVTSLLLWQLLSVSGCFFASTIYRHSSSIRARQ